MLNPGNNALALLIAEALKNRCTHETLPGVAEDVGFALGEATSKRDRALAGLKTADRKTLGAIAEHVGRRFTDSIWKKLGASFLRRESHLSARLRGATLRRRSGHDLAGERAIDDVLRPLWPIDSMGDVFFSSRPLAQQIVQHMILNPTDWDAEYLFGELGAFTCSRSRFARLLEAVMHPLARRGPEAQRLGSELNEILRRDGYKLETTGEASSYPIYALSRLHRGGRGCAKKPDLRLDWTEA